VAATESPTTKRRQPWPFNPMVSLIRQHSTEIIDNVLVAYEAKSSFKASAFDLVIQTMIVACSYKPEEIWLSDGEGVKTAHELIEKDAADMAYTVLDAGIENGTITLNEKLVKRIAANQIKRLHRLHKTHAKELHLPTYGDRALSAFGPNAELCRFQLVNSQDDGDVCEAVAVEKTSQEKVVFKRIDLALSKAYIETFHYLHSVRDDDTFAFGAFVEGEEMPFAVVAYAPVGRKYKLNMLKSAGVDLKATVELTRAWNGEDAPKNTMSLLYAYAHANIQKLFLLDRKQTLTVVTAVNPNLGFKGSAFRAVGFSLIGHKPTSFYYLVDQEGNRTFTTRRDLSKKLEGAKSVEVEYRSAQFPLLATKELAVYLRGSQRMQHSGAVYDIDEGEYIQDMPAIAY
jgi:hypothetical protein